MKNNVWFIADTHFSHLNSMYHQPRRREAAGITLKEFQNTDKKELIERYDNWLIDKWNSTIKKDDMVYILGDFCLANKVNTEKILQKLHGKKWLIRGNHDKSCNGLEKYFMWVGDIKEAKFNHDQFPFIKEGETFCVEMCHYPMMSWNRKPHGTCHLHGHCHNGITEINKQSEELRVDVGFDSELANYDFINLEKLYNYFRGIVINHGFDSFEDYIEYLYEKRGYRD